MVLITAWYIDRVTGSLANRRQDKRLDIGSERFGDGDRRFDHIEREIDELEEQIENPK